MVPAFAYRTTRLAAALLALSCAPAEERPGHHSTPKEAGLQEEGGIRPFEAGPPPADGAGFCGNQLIPVILERPNVYFIMDRSGSMEAMVDRYNRYTTARLAIGEVLRAIGHRISYGAAVLPAFHNPDNCATGKQVFAATQGDPITADRTQNGPTLQTFLRLLASYPPSGNTPVAATLVALTPTLLALSGRTVAILATDGGPNCNLEARCSAASCIANIEGVNPLCTGDFNCCDPANVRDGQVLCVDEDATIAALENLAQHDVSTYVVGLPGSNVYADALNRFAAAGRTAREGVTRYYAADDQPELTGALREILGSVAISCDIALDAKPPNSAMVNVYFDQRVVPLNAAHGWSWLDDRTLRIQGSRCEELKSGDVGQVQVLSGCTTVVE